MSYSNSDDICAGILCIFYFYGIKGLPCASFCHHYKDATIEYSCSNNDLFPLFFPGNELIKDISIENFSVEVLNDYLKNA